MAMAMASHRLILYRGGQLDDNFCSNNISPILRFNENKIVTVEKKIFLSTSNFFIFKWNVKFFTEWHLILSNSFIMTIDDIIAIRDYSSMIV